MKDHQCTLSCLAQKAAYKVYIPENTVNSYKYTKGRPVYQIDKNTNRIIARFDNGNIAGRFFGKPNGKNINYCCNQKRNNITAYGFKWKFVPES